MPTNEQRRETIHAHFRDAYSYDFDRVTEASSAVANANIAAALGTDDAGFNREHVLERIEGDVALALAQLMKALCIDIRSDHNTMDTPARVAKMYVREVMRGRYDPMPDITGFPNAGNLDELYVTGPITVRSMCSHHLVPIVGRAWVGIVPGDTVIGLSKFNRLVEWVFARPQIQEEATVQLADIIEKAANPKGLAVLVDATHMCMTWRGVREGSEASMRTSVLRGVMRKPEARSEFFELVKL